LNSNPVHNTGQQFRHKKPYNRNNYQPNWQHHTPNGTFEGRRHLPGPGRLGYDDDGHSNSDGQYIPQYKPNDAPYGSVDKYIVKNLGLPSTDYPLQLDQHGRGPAAGPSRRQSFGSKPLDSSSLTGERKQRILPVNHPVPVPDGIKVLPREDSDQKTYTADSVEHFESSPRTSTAQEEGRSLSPTYWEDDYEQRDEEPALPVRKHFPKSTSSSAPGEGSVTVAGQEPNPWLS